MSTIDAIDIGEAVRPYAGVTFVLRFTIHMHSVAAWLSFILDRRRSRVALLELTDEQRRANMDAIAKVSALTGMASKALR